MEGDNEGFLAFCTNDTTWTFVGEKTLSGKDAVREWMKESYKEPPRFTVINMIADGVLLLHLDPYKSRMKKGRRKLICTATFGSFVVV